MWTNHSRVEKALLKNRSLIVIIENVLLCMFEMYRIVHFDRSYVIVYECFFLLNFSSLCWMWKVKSCYSWCGFSMENFIFPLARDNFGITLSDISNWHPFLFVSWKHSFRFFFLPRKMTTFNFSLIYCGCCCHCCTFHLSFCLQLSTTAHSHLVINTITANKAFLRMTKILYLRFGHNEWSEKIA